MSSRSEAVKKWRKNTKLRLLEAMGNKCVICKYDRCASALEFHHLDPKEKDIGLGAIRASIRNWKSIVEEVKKCVILCCRCHREYHDGLVKIPKNIPKFDSKLEDYKALERKKVVDNCPICDKLKNKANVTCSPECAGKKRSKVNWKQVDLKEMYGRMSVIKIAESLGVSDAAIHKRLKKLGLK